MKIAYLASKYPAVSHTFVLREVQALRGRGLEVSTFSVRRPDSENILGPSAAAEASTTRWIVPPRLAEFLAAVIVSFGVRPLRTLRTLWKAVAGRQMSLARRAKWLCYWGEALLLARWLNDGAFEHLHCHFGNSGSSTGMLAADLAGIPFSVTCHGSEILDLEKHRLVEKVEQAAFVACVSKFGRAQLMMACPPENWTKMHIVRCGVTMPQRSEPPVRSDTFRILCVARLSKEKGHLVLLHALADLRDQGVPYHCTLVGDGPMRGTVESRIAKLKLNDRLTLAGALCPGDVVAHYQSTDVVVLSSFSEGVPVVLMEAMAHLRPVVATQVGGIPELVQDGTGGLLVPPGDWQALAAALRRIYDEPEWAATLACHGQFRVRDEFSLDVGAARLADLFEGTAHARDGRAPNRKERPALCLPGVPREDC